MSGATYRYAAIQADGQRMSGTLVAPSRDEAIDDLYRRGWFPLSVATVSATGARCVRVPVYEQAIGFRMLASLLDSGLPIGKALIAFTAMAPSSWTFGLDAVQSAVHDGQSFSIALGQSPLNIPPVVIGMLTAGELGDGLAPATRRAAELLERSAATRSAIRNALAYPAVLAVAGFASLVLLLGVVLPRFANMLTDIGQTLPRTTQLVLNAASTIRMMAFPSCFAAGILIGIWTVWVQTIDGRARWHGWLLQLPWVGPLRLETATARVSAALASLLESGVPIVHALPHGARAADDAAIERAITAAREQIVHGERPSVALESSGALTRTAIRLVRAGEESGRLAAMLSHAATIEQERAEQRVRSAVRILEPSLILAFGGIVALVAAAMLQAVYSVRPGAS